MRDRSILYISTKTYASDRDTDVVKLSRRTGPTELTVAYACRFSNGAKRNRSNLVAIGTGDGAVHLLDLKEGTQPVSDAANNPIPHTHSGPIHDLQWSRSDAYVACAGGDGTASVHDVRTNKMTALLEGHSNAVKSVGWNTISPGVVYTGGRDGEILLWDLRISRAGRIINRMQAKPSRRTRGSAETICTTSIIQATGGQRELISASAIDGKLRKWDMRLGSGNAGNIAQTADDPTISSGSRRPRGITSVVKGSVQTKGKIFGLAFDSQVHVYDETSLDVLQCDYGSNGTNKTMRCMSFWVKMSINRNGQQLLSGGQDGSAFLWNTSRVGIRDSVHGLQESQIISALKGHKGEVGAVDFGGDTMVTCGDDAIVRFWREISDVPDAPD